MKSLKQILKKNKFVRGVYYLYKTYFGFEGKGFGYKGDQVTLIPPLFISNPSNVYLYGYNKLENATILCTNAKFIMKKYAGTTPGLIVTTGNHAMIPGRFYRTITESEKPEGLDKDVIIECDAWVGSRVVLLSGVTIGRSCTVAAGSVVTKSTPPYSIVGGVPAKFIKFKWTIDEILEHEAALYPEDERFTREELESIFAQYQKK